jgi:uncharacterized membrane protein (UPF0127 family)
MQEPIPVRARPLTDWWGRTRGLLGRPPPPPGQAVWLAPCRQVHTFGMRYAIDVVHLAPGGRILAVQTLRPWRVGRFVWGARGVLELAAGQARVMGLDTGGVCNLIEVGCGATQME